MAGLASKPWRHPNLFTKWKRQAAEMMVDLFSGRARGRETNRSAVATSMPLVTSVITAILSLGESTYPLPTFPMNANPNRVSRGEELLTGYCRIRALAS